MATQTITYAQLETQANCKAEAIRQAVARGSLTKAGRGLVVVDERLEAWLQSRGIAGLQRPGNAAPREAAPSLEQLPEDLRDRMAAVAHDGLRASLTHALLHHLPARVREYREQGNTQAKAITLARAAVVWQVGVETVYVARVGYGMEAHQCRMRDFVQALEVLALPYADCGSEAYLYRKLAGLRRSLSGVEADVTVQPKNAGNQNALVMGPIQRHFVEYIVAGGMNPTATQLARRVAYVCDTYNTLYLDGDKALKVPSVRSIEAYLAIPEVRNRLREYVDGKKATWAAMSQYLPRYAPAHAHDLWEVDSTRLQVRYLRRLPDGSRKIGFASITVVADIHSRAIVGWSLSTGEDRDSVKRALYMAVRSTQRLPYELLTDNGPAMAHPESKALMKAMATEVRKARVGNARDKRVERIIFSFQDQAQRELPVYVGGGVKDTRRGAHPTEEAMEAQWRDRQLPDWDGLVALTGEAVAMHNGARNMIGRDVDTMTRRERLAEVSPVSDPVTPQTIAELFWDRRNETIRAGYIRVIDRKVEYLYVVPTELRLKLEGETVSVALDTTNMEGGVYVWQGDRALGHMPLQPKAHGAAANMHGKDWEIMKGVHSRNQEFAAHVAAENERITREALEEHLRLTGDPDTNDISEAEFIATFPFATLDDVRRDGRKVHKPSIEAAEERLMQEINPTPSPQPIIPPARNWNPYETNPDEDDRPSLYDLPL